MLKQTPSQTVGPFFSYGLTPEEYGKAGITSQTLINTQTQGERIRIEGRILDGQGQGISDALVEIWQANSTGRYHHPSDNRADVALDNHFNGFGRAATDANGAFWFETIKPGAVPGRGNTLQAPHINIVVMMRGLLSHVYTRLYFADETEANSDDPVLALVEEARRSTLLAQCEETLSGTVFRFDIQMQGNNETVFFDA